MMNGKLMLKRCSALFLCLVLFVSLLPVSHADYKLAAPTLVSIEYKNGGLQISWNAVSGAAGYSVHRKENGGAWHTLARGVHGTSYLDKNLTGNTTYTYTVRCNDGSNNFSSWYDSTGLTYTINWAYATPALKSITSTTGSVTITWDAVSGNPRYSVHRSDNGGAWHTIAKGVSGTSYTDKTVKSGVQYYYTVRAVNGSNQYASWYETPGLKATPGGGGGGSWAYATPALGTITNTGSGIQITWSAVAKAPKYSVHRKVNDGMWTTLSKNVTGTSYKDTSVSSGNKYEYTVRVVDNSGNYASWYQDPGLTMSLPGSPVTWQFSTPVLKKISYNSNGITITWDPVVGTTRYSIHRKVNGGGWSTIAKIDKATSYTDTNVENGKTYEYTVRALNKSNQFASWYQDPGLSTGYYRCATPDFTLTSVASGLQISWKGVGGAEKYRVFRMSGGKWVGIKDTTATSFIDTQVVSGETYTYTVRCISGDGKTYTSWFHPGKSATYYKDGIITKLENKDGFVRLTWKEIKGAWGYRILRKANNESEWKTIKEVSPSSTTTYDDYQVVSNTNYTYIVRGLKAANGAYVGDYDKDGKSIRFYDAPDLIEATVDTGGITVTWNPVVGVTLYPVYRWNADAGKWDAIGTTSDLFFVDNNVNVQSNYKYTVACLSSDGKNVISGYDETGVGATWLNTPVLISATLNENTVVVKWKPVGARTRTKAGIELRLLAECSTRMAT